MTFPISSHIKRLALCVTAGAVVIGSASVLSGCGGSEAVAETIPPVNIVARGTAVYNVRSAPPPTAKAGDILYAQARDDAPAGAKGWTVIYVSEIKPGQLMYVSGEIYVPTAASDHPRDVVLWNHATVGFQDVCAPSRETLTASRIPGMAELIAQGNVIVMSDYPGMGMAGPNFYMAGQPNARASLDMLRVAQNFPDAKASKRYVMYGWSQGGQTTMWAESIAATYAPEFKGLGAGLIAPAVRIRELTLNSMTDTALAGYVVATLPGIKTYVPELKYGDFLTAEGMELLPVLADGCWDIFAAGATAKAPYKPDALTPGSSWWKAMTAVDDFQPKGSMPFVIYQGSADTTTPVRLTLPEMDKLCKAGSTVEYNEYPGLDHGPVVPEAAKRFPSWVKERFSGAAAKSNCRV